MLLQVDVVEEFFILNARVHFYELLDQALKHHCTSLEKLPGIGSLPGSTLLPVMHIGRVQEDIGLSVWHIKLWQMKGNIPSDWLVIFRLMTVL